MKRKYLLLIIFIFIILFAGNDYKTVDLSNKFIIFSNEHILGTDNLGRDVFALMKVATIRSLIVIIVSSVGAMILGTFVGIVSCSFSDFFERIILTLADLILILPTFIVALIITSLYGLNIFTVCSVVIVTESCTYIFFVNKLTKKIMNTV